MSTNRIDFNAEDALKEYEKMLKHSKVQLESTPELLTEEKIKSRASLVSEAYERVAKGEKRVDLFGEDFKVVGYIISGQNTIRVDVRDL